MPYVLGIDIGGTSTTAAVTRLTEDGWTRPEPAKLGARSSAIGSLLQLGSDGSLIVGDPAEYGQPPDRERTARGFLRRIGDPVPMLVGGEAWTPEALTAVLVTWVVERVMAQQSDRPAEQVVLSHPASWGAYRKEVLRQALWAAGIPHATLLPEPVVAAESHACQGFTGSALAVYALGGESYAGSVVGRSRTGGFELVAGLDGVEPLGGSDFDAALLRQVGDRLTRTAGRPRHLADERSRPALLGLAEACLSAKERLTVAGETDVRLHLPDGPTRVPVSRVEFEELIRPGLRLTVEHLAGVVRTAGLAPEQLDGVLLIGGSARIPLVAELVGRRLTVPVTVQADPQLTAAAGAAWAARQIVAPTRPPRPPRWDGPQREDPGRSPAGIPAVRPEHRPDDGGRREPPPRPPINITPLRLPRNRLAQSGPARPATADRATFSRARS
nr:Hsp70 family protein [Micromonospora sp. DSM 115978]